MKLVDSSNVARIGYDSINAELWVEYKGGAMYVYMNVPPHIWDGLDGSASKGTYMNTVVKPAFQFRYP
jgi:hypothetical protein